MTRRTAVLIVLRSSDEGRSVAYLMPTDRPNFGGFYVQSTNKARAVVEQQASRNTRIGYVVVEESIALTDGGSGSVSETLRFLGELDKDYQGRSERPRVFVLTERFHGDKRFAAAYPGCITHRKVNVINGSTQLDLS